MSPSPSPSPLLLLHRVLSSMAGLARTVVVAVAGRTLLLCVCRGKTTRPQEWTDRSKFAPKVHPDQRPELETRNSLGHKWMDVRWKNRNSAETLIHSIASDDTRRSDPEEARCISDQKLAALRKSLTARG